MKNFAFDKTPVTSDFWKNLDDNQRKDLIIKEISKNEIFKEFEISQVLNDGQIVFRVSKTIPSNKRGDLLLDLEERLKEKIDKALTVWFEPVGDSSKLRNLRGIKINF